MKKAIITITALMLVLCLLTACASTKDKVSKFQDENVIIEDKEDDIISENNNSVEDDTVNNEAPIEDELPTSVNNDNIIILPDADEDTIELTIEFPEDFSEEPYTTPNLVSPNEFEWGEYVPFVAYVPYKTEEYFFDFAFLGNGISSLSEGNVLYNKFNKSYLTEYPIIENLNFGVHNTSNNSYLNEKLFQSHIIYISEDAKKIGKYSLIATEEENYKYGRVWNSKFELYDNNSLIYSNDIKNLSEGLFPSGYYIDFISGRFTHPELLEKYKINDELRCIFTNHNTIVCTDTAVHSNKLFVFSLDSNRMSYEISLPYIEKEANGIKETLIASFQDIRNNNIVLQFSKSILNTNETIIAHYNSSYLYNLKTQKLTFLQTYTEDAMLSPDEIYLIYTSLDADLVTNGISDMKEGYYIKNLKTKNITYYPYIHDSILRDSMGNITINWVDKNNIINT